VAGNAVEFVEEEKAAFGLPRRVVGAREEPLEGGDRRMLGRYRAGQNGGAECRQAEEDLREP
jgi:hypothetical protein